MNLLTDTLTALSTGVPGLVVAGLTLIVMLLALIRKEAGLMAVAAFMLIPFSYAIGDWSGISLVVRLLPIFPLLSAFAISREETLFAWILPLPPFAYLVYLIFNLLTFRV